MTSKKGETRSHFYKHEPIYKKGDKNNYINYRGISSISVGRKLL